MKKNQERKQKPVSYGGQALLEGVMMRGKSGMALSIVAPDGEIMTETTRLKMPGGFSAFMRKTPIVRGCIAFFASMKMSIQTLLKSAEVSSEKEEMPGKGWMYFSAIIGVFLSIGLFMILPFILSNFFDRSVADSGGIHILYRSLLEGGLRLVIFILFLFLVSRLKGIRRNFMFHGAEHKTINCFESAIKNGKVDENGRVLSSAMTIEKVKACSTRHNRCGTTFLFFVMLIAILVFALTNWLFDIWGITARVYDETGELISGNFHNISVFFMRMGIRLALLPLVAGLSFEMLKGLAALPDNWFVKIFRAPGLALQRLTTYEPDDDQMLEVAIISFMAAKAMDEDENIADLKFGQKTIIELREQIADNLKNTNADSSEIDWILCHVYKCKRNEISFQEKSTLDQYLSIKDILKRRQCHEPLWYILGYTDFYKSRIFVNKNALIPRNDTEILVENAIKIINDNELKNILEIGTGSGCIAKALSKFTNAKIYASDVSEEALRVAKKNLGDKVALYKGDMFNQRADKGDNMSVNEYGIPCEIKFDLIISNPPYIKTADIEALDEEVKNYEPLLALDGGEDGLKYYKIFAGEAQNHLVENGCLMLEIGADQAEEVNGLLKENFTNIKTIKDLNGLDRVVTAKKK